MYIQTKIYDIKEEKMYMVKESMHTHLKKSIEKRKKKKSMANERIKIVIINVPT